MKFILHARRRNQIVWSLGLALGALTAPMAACSDDSSTLPPAADDGTTPPPGPIVTSDASTDNQADASGDPTETDASNADANVTPDDAGADAADGQVEDGDPPPDGRCRSTANCADPKLGCFFYEEPNCDPQTTNYCLDDDACTAIDPNFVCDTPRTSCGAACIPGCDGDADCKLGTKCNTASRHCEIRTCVSSTDCPNGNFACNNSLQGAFCKRLACTKDDECEGRCVTEKNALSGYCIEDWGVCATP